MKLPHLRNSAATPPPPQLPPSPPRLTSFPFSIAQGSMSPPDPPGTTRRSKQTSCFACVDAKRRCDKAHPSCSRCIDKQVDCVYPPPKQPRRHQRHIDEAIIRTPSSELSDNRGIVRDQAPENSPLSAGAPGDLRWFLRPSVWNVAYHYDPPSEMPSGPTISNFIRGIKVWLFRFLRDGHNPFIHRLLYQAKPMPQCMQDAYAAIAISQNVTSENEHMVDKISSSQISALLASQPAEGSLPFTLLSTKDHLARTQALLIHLLLALFSPSIPRRAEAENLIDTLLRWTNQLWQSATQDTVTVPFFQNTFLLTERTEFCANIHEIFVICETIRRTWLLGNLATGVFQSLKGDWSAACAGDIYITARAELWDAPSLARWEAAVGEKDPLFIYSLEGQSLLSRGVHASQVDEFARHIFTIMWGMDKVENWVARTGDGISLIYQEP
ncbi:hypothetical protein FDECE_13643 [Fusarium decemcellulare]|nr:hypothetical protein FDECE_13643 [Fusarium decemcellulare]